MSLSSQDSSSGGKAQLSDHRKERFFRDFHTLCLSTDVVKTFQQGLEAHRKKYGKYEIPTSLKGINREVITSYKTVCMYLRHKQESGENIYPEMLDALDSLT